MQKGTAKSDSEKVEKAQQRELMLLQGKRS